MAKRSYELYENNNEYRNNHKKRKKQVYCIDNSNLEKEDAKVRRQEKIKVRKRKLEDLKNCQIIENHAKKRMLKHYPK